MQLKKEWPLPPPTPSEPAPRKVRLLAFLLDLFFFGLLGYSFFESGGRYAIEAGANDYVTGLIRFFLHWDWQRSLFFLTYFGTFWLALGGTPGKLVVGLKIVERRPNKNPASAPSYRKVSPQKVLLRLLFFVPSLFSLVGGLWLFFDPRRRALHDRLAGTEVLFESDQPLSHELKPAAEAPPKPK